MTYLDTVGIKEAFAQHLMKYRGYTKEEADFAVSDFPDGDIPYLISDYLGECEIDGEIYYKDACHTMLWLVGIHNIPDFQFYRYYRASDIPNHKVGEYLAAKKLYQIENLNSEDFPNM